MQDMRHLNLFRDITKISTRFCFEYNDTIFFLCSKEFNFKSNRGEWKKFKAVKQYYRKKDKDNSRAKAGNFR